MGLSRAQSPDAYAYPSKSSHFFYHYLSSLPAHYNHTPDSPQTLSLATLVKTMVHYEYTVWSQYSTKATWSSYPDNLKQSVYTCCCWMRRGWGSIRGWWGMRRVWWRGCCGSGCGRSAGSWFKRGGGFSYGGGGLGRGLLTCS